MGPEDEMGKCLIVLPRLTTRWAATRRVAHVAREAGGTAGTFGRLFLVEIGLLALDSIRPESESISTIGFLLGGWAR